jgi:alcohol dehydrogenase zinc-binding domain protein
MKTKAIAFIDIGKAELIEKEVPEISDHEVLVHLSYSTISNGTERANLMGDPFVSVKTIKRDVSFPRFCGYSSSGVVVAVGKNVDNVKEGDRVALSWSTHSEYVVIPAENVHRIDDNRISFSDAALLHIMTFPLGAIRKCHVELGEPVIVMGQGILGMFAVLLLRCAGAAPLIAVDPIDSKRNTAIRLGADAALNPYDLHFSEDVRSITNGGAKVAIEVTGFGKALDQVLDCMAPMGRVALLGCTRNSDFSIDYYHKVHGPGISLIGAHTMARPQWESSFGLWTTHDDVLAIMHLISLGRINLKGFVSEVHSPNDAEEVYHRLATDPEFPVVQFDWTGR